MLKEKFLIPHGDAIHVVDYSTILFFKSNNCYTHIFLQNGSQFVLVKSLAKLEKEINSPTFIRISQSFLVNSQFITCIHKKKRYILLEKLHVLPFTISIKTLLNRMVSLS